MTDKQIITKKFKIYGKKKDFAFLDRCAKEVNLVWNYCNEVSIKIHKEYYVRSYYIDSSLKNSFVDKKQEIKCNEGSPYTNDIKYKLIYNFINDLDAKKKETQKNKKETGLVVEKNLSKKELNEIKCIVYQAKENPLNIHEPIQLTNFYHKNDDFTQVFYYFNPFKKTNKIGAVETLDVSSGSISNYDLEKLVGGMGDFLTINSSTIYSVCKEYAKAMMAKKKGVSKGSINSTFGNFISFRGRKDRPWIPVKGSGIQVSDKFIKLFGKKLKVNFDKAIDPSSVCDAKFVKEASGWYVCISLEEHMDSQFIESVSQTVGVDLGLRSLVTTSSGNSYSVPSLYVQLWGKKVSAVEAIEHLQSLEKRLSNKRGKAKPTSKENWIRNKRLKLEEQLKNTRTNAHYNIANNLFKEAEVVVVGDLSPKWIQSVHGKKSKEQSVGGLKEKLEWVAKKNNKIVEFINESYTSQTCFSCKTLSGPGSKLGEKNGIKPDAKHWSCHTCGQSHDRDVNGAKNIEYLYLESIKSSEEAAF